MTATIYSSHSIWQGTSLVVMSRLTQADGQTAIVSANVSTITRTIGTMVSGIWSIGSPVSLVVGTVIGALATNNGWTVDSIGYNLRDIIPASLLGVAGNSEVEYTITLTDGTVSILVIAVVVKAVFN